MNFLEEATKSPVESENSLWVEKYRPKIIDDCILPEATKKTFKDFLATGEIPNLLLSGTAGTGKTTVAKALCNELGCDVMMINGSDEGRSIDVVRNQIKNFASTVSLHESDKPKVVIVDEADYMNAESVQPALRNFMEEYSKNCGFILTCNFKNRLIPPLHSRCSVVDFIIPNEQKPKLASRFFARVGDILNSEGVEFEPKAVAELMNKFFPDWRRVLNAVSYTHLTLPTKRIV